MFSILVVISVIEVCDLLMFGVLIEICVVLFLDSVSDIDVLFLWLN